MTVTELQQQHDAAMAAVARWEACYLAWGGARWAWERWAAAAGRANQIELRLFKMEAAR